jgi:hypothetical protein
VIEHHLALNRVSDRCRRWALGAVEVAECGAFLSAGRPISAVAALLRVALHDPRRFIEEVFVRVPAGLFSSLSGHLGGKGPPGPAFGTLDPAAANPPRQSQFTFSRLAALAREDVERAGALRRPDSTHVA